MRLFYNVCTRISFTKNPAIPEPKTINSIIVPNLPAFDFFAKSHVNNLALKDEAFLAFRPHLIKRKRLLLSKRLWIDAMGEVYDSRTGFLKRVVIPLLKDALTF